MADQTRDESAVEGAKAYLEVGGEVDPPRQGLDRKVQGRWQPRGKFGEEWYHSTYCTFASSHLRVGHAEKSENGR